MKKNPGNKGNLFISLQVTEDSDKICACCLAFDHKNQNVIGLGMLKGKYVGCLWLGFECWSMAALGLRTLS